MTDTIENTNAHSASEELSLRIELQSDATFSSGQGLATALDVEIAHDKNGLPCVGGKALKGILKKEAEEIISALRLQQKNGELTEDDVARYEAGFYILFGDTGGKNAFLDVSNAILPAPFTDAVATAIRKNIIKPAQVINAFTVTQRQTAIGVDDVPEKSSLRNRRAVRRQINGKPWRWNAAMVLKPFPHNACDVDDVHELLAASVMSLRRGGMSRNRGAGHLGCQLEKSDGKDITFAYWGEFPRTKDSSEQRQTTVQSNSVAIPTPPLARAASDSKKQTILLHLRFQQPVILSHLSGDPNSVESQQYAPGSVIQGALVARYLSPLGGTMDSADPQVRDLFFNGKCRILNAYPALPEPNRDFFRRFLPTPRSLRKDKDERGDDSAFASRCSSTGYYDHSIDSIDESDATIWKTASHEFCSLTDGDGIYLMPVGQRQSVHITTGGGASNPERGIYRYQSIEPEQDFVGAILCESQEIANEIIQLLKLESHISLGRSKNAEYGTAEIARFDVVEGWREIADDVREHDLRGEFHVTLLSDCLLQNPAGHFIVDPHEFTKAICTSLGIAENELKLVANKSFITPTLSGGFNNKWGLPLPQSPTLQKGSVFTFILENGTVIPEKKIAQLEWDGIGARREIGFGRIAVNWQNESIRNATKFDIPDPPDVDVTDADSKILLEHLVGYCMEEKLSNLLQAKIQNEDAKIQNPPANSQLQELRENIADKMTKGESYQSLKTTVEELRNRNATRQQFADAQIGGQRLQDWLENMINMSEEAVRQFFSLDLLDDVIIGGVSLGTSKKSRNEAMLRYLDGVLKRASKAGRKN